MRLVFQCLLIVGLLTLSVRDARCYGQELNQPWAQTIAALQFYNSGDFRNAAISFLKAYKQDGDYRHLYYIAVSQSRLNNYQQAITFYLRYMQEGAHQLSSNDRLTISREVERLKEVAIGSRVAVQAPAPVSSGHEQSFEPVTPTDDLQAEQQARQEAARAHQAGQEQRNRKIAEKKAKEGRRLFSRGKYSRAADAFDEAYNIYPNPYYLCDLARVATKQGNWKVAIYLYNLFLSEAEGDVAGQYRDTVQREMAEINGHIQAEEQKKEAEGRFELGITLIEKKEHARALDELSKSYRFKPNPETLYHLARAQEGLGQYQQAKTSYEQYLATAGKSVPSLRREEIRETIRQLDYLGRKKFSRQKAMEQNQAGRKLARAGKHEQALRIYGQAYRYYPDPNILFNIGESAAALKKNQMAIDAYTQFLRGTGASLKESRRIGIESIIKRLQSTSEREQKEQNARSLLESGQSLNKRRHYTMALRDFLSSYAVLPNPETLYQIAVTQSLLRKHREAIATYRQYLEDSRGKITSSRRKMVHAELKRFQQILEVKLVRKESERLYQTGLSLAARKEYDKAVEEFRIAYDMSLNFEILVSLAEAESALDRPQAAVQAYTKYLSLGGGRIAPQRRMKIRKEIARLVIMTRGRAN